MITSKFDLIEIYKNAETRFGPDTYKHLSEILQEAKIVHKQFFLNSDAAQKTKDEGRIPDHEQSWKAVKGKGFEKLLLYIICDCIQKLGLKIINGNKLERKSGSNITSQLSQVKRNLVIDYGEYGCHLPDVDLVVYHPDTSKVITVISCKTTLRERVAQTGYWKLKLSECVITEHIKVLFVTLDEDSTLTCKMPAKKGRAIAEIDTDGTYVLTTNKLEESSNVKLFDKLIQDIKRHSGVT